MYLLGVKVRFSEILITFSPYFDRTWPEYETMMVFTFITDLSVFPILDHTVHSIFNPVKDNSYRKRYVFHMGCFTDLLNILESCC